MLYFTFPYLKWTFTLNILYKQGATKYLTELHFHEFYLTK